MDKYKKMEMIDEIHALIKEKVPKGTTLSEILGVLELIKFRYVLVRQKEISLPDMKKD